MLHLVVKYILHASLSGRVHVHATLCVGVQVHAAVDVDKLLIEV